MIKRNQKKYILSKVDDYNIFRHYFGPFNVGDIYHSVFRTDRNKSTGFYMSKGGRLIYNDFATGDKLNCFDFVAKKFQLSEEEAYDKIMFDFGIKGDNPHPVHLVELSKVDLEKKEKLIQVRPDSWDERSLFFWNDYCITEKELIENSVYFVKDLYINGTLINNRENKLRYAYLLDDQDKSYVKIYAPFDNDLKWISSIPNNKPFGLNELPKKSNILIITKSQKDRIIWKKYFTDVIATQNESRFALTDEDIFWMQDNYEYIYLNFDPDAAGQKAALQFRDEFGFKLITTPEKTYLEGIKDVADMVKAGGLKAFEEFLIYKKLLNGKRTFKI